jgi:hypothetical protein
MKLRSKFLIIIRNFSVHHSSFIVRGMPSKQFQYAHGAQDFSEKQAPLPLTWALFGHVADCPLAGSG